MVLNCSGLNMLPELDKWNTSNLKKYSLMFSNYKTTLNYPVFTKKMFNNQSIIIQQVQ